MTGSFQSQDPDPQPISALCPCTQMPSVTPPGSWGVSESLSLDCPCCSEPVFANLSYYLLLSASSQAWPVPSWCLWLSFGGSGWGRTCAGSLVRSWMAQLALEPAVLVALAVCQAGRGHCQVPTQDNSHSVLLKPGCSSSVSGVQLMLSMLPWLLCSLFLALFWIKPTYL